MKKIWDYFKEVVDYPNDILHNPIPYNVCWSYVSATLLNGFINYTKPVLSVYVLDRYTGLNKKVDLDTPIDKVKGKNVKFAGTKGDLINGFLSGALKIHHAKLSCFKDDVVVLGEIPMDDFDNGLHRFIFFWFDCDVSDCSIGRFETTDSIEDVNQSIINWLESEKDYNKNKKIVEGYDNGIIDYHKLPTLFMSGWVSF